LRLPFSTFRWFGSERGAPFLFFGVPDWFVSSVFLLRGVALIGVIVRGAALIGVILRDATLTGIIPRGAALIGVDVTPSSLPVLLFLSGVAACSLPVLLILSGCALFCEYHWKSIQNKSVWYHCRENH
jgi:hypothetical protein